MKTTKKLLFAVLLLILQLNVFAQTEQEYKLYAYSGKIDKYPISMILWITPNNDVYGVYCYQKVGQFINLKGTFSQPNKFTIYELDENDKTTATFSLVSEKDMLAISGTWTTADNKKTLSIALARKQPIDDTYVINSKKGNINIYFSAIDTTIFGFPFKRYEYSLNFCLNNNCDDKPSYDAKNFTVVPKSNTSNANLQKISQKFNSAYFLKYLCSDFSSYLTDLQNYDSINDADQVYSYKYEYEIGDYPESLTNNFLTYSESYYDYTGGAHGNYGQGFTTFDLKTGDTLKLNKIFDSKYINTISQLIRDEISNNEDIKEGVFEIESVEATENFNFTEDSITFVYNPYEIACYATGLVEIPISFSKLSQYMQPWFKQRMGIK